MSVQTSKKLTEAVDLYQLKELLPPDVYGELGNGIVRVPTWAFWPDHWTYTFLRGLGKLADELQSAKLWEIGVGTGINLVALSRRIHGATWFFSDYNPDCVSLAAFNLQSVGIKGNYIPLLGSRNLVQAKVGETNPKVDVLFGCLPQVPTANGIDGDRVAHYYDPAMYPTSRMHSLGLALNEALLKSAGNVLLGKGKVVLNLSGRPGLPQLERLFKECGYAPRVLHEETVPQHAETSLKSLAMIEDADSAGAKFEFFADSEARICLSANQAEVRRRAGQSVYHKIYVIEGTLQ